LPQNLPNFTVVFILPGTAAPAPTPAPGSCGGPRQGTFPSLNNPHTITDYGSSNNNIGDGGQDA